MANSKVEREYFQAPDITLRVTDRCNLHCTHCFADSSAHLHENELTTEEVCSIIDWASDNGTFRLGITGGEPTLREDLLTIIAYAKSRDLWTMLTTNGFAVSEALCKGLSDNQIDQVDVSVDHSSPSLHDAFRGQPGVYDQALNTIGLLQDYNIPTAITTVISSWNFDNFHQLYELAQRLHVSMFKVDAFIAIGRGDMNLALTAGQFKWLYEWFSQSHDSDSQMLLGNFSDKFDFLYDEAAYSSDILQAVCGYRGQPVCEAGITRCTITAQGTVLPCSYFCTEEFYAGNMRSSSLDHIWHDSAVMNRMREEHAFQGICSTCEHNIRCRGGCRARAYYMGEHPQGPDPYCWIAYPEEGENSV
jgi:radical SAM protein with 4Fe4S-binding SPASM domain